MSKVKLGYKHGSDCAISKPKKNEMYYPNMYISETELPLEPEEIGSVLTATVKLKFTGVNESKRSSGNDSCNYDFEVHEIEFSPKKNKGSK